MPLPQTIAYWVDLYTCRAPDFNTWEIDSYVSYIEFPRERRMNLGWNLLPKDQNVVYEVVGEDGDIITVEIPVVQRVRGSLFMPPGFPSRQVVQQLGFYRNNIAPRPPAYIDVLCGGELASGSAEASAEAAGFSSVLAEDLVSLESSGLVVSLPEGLSSGSSQSSRICHVSGTPPYENACDVFCAGQDVFCSHRFRIYGNVSEYPGADCNNLPDFLQARDWCCEFFGTDTCNVIIDDLQCDFGTGDYVADLIACCLSTDCTLELSSSFSAVGEYSLCPGQISGQSSLQLLPPEPSTDVTGSAEGLVSSSSSAESTGPDVPVGSSELAVQESTISPPSEGSETVAVTSSEESALSDTVEKATSSAGEDSQASAVTETTLVSSSQSDAAGDASSVEVEGSLAGSAKVDKELLALSSSSSLTTGAGQVPADGSSKELESSDSVSLASDTQAPPKDITDTSSSSSAAAGAIPGEEGSEPSGTGLAAPSSSSDSLGGGGRECGGLVLTTGDSTPYSTEVFIGDTDCVVLRYRTYTIPDTIIVKDDQGTTLIDTGPVSTGGSSNDPNAPFKTATIFAPNSDTLTLIVDPSTDENTVWQVEVICTGCEITCAEECTRLSNVVQFVDIDAAIAYMNILDCEATCIPDFSAGIIADTCGAFLQSQLLECPSSSSSDNLQEESAVGGTLIPPGHGNPLNNCPVLTYSVGCCCGEPFSQLCEPGCEELFNGREDNLEDAQAAVNALTCNPECGSWIRPVVVPDPIIGEGSQSALPEPSEVPCVGLPLTSGDDTPFSQQVFTGTAECIKLRYRTFQVPDRIIIRDQQGDIIFDTGLVSTGYSPNGDAVYFEENISCTYKNFIRC